jgi:hypothetical protein
VRRGGRRERPDRDRPGHAYVGMAVAYIVCGVEFSRSPARRRTGAFTLLASPERREDGSGGLSPPVRAGVSKDA